MNVLSHKFCTTVMLILPLLVSQASWLFAQATEKTDKPAGIRAAVIDLERSSIAVILEAKLLSNREVDWLERTEIDRLLKEQELQAAFSATGLKERLSLGKLLKADVLVMLRTIPALDKKQGKQLECVVCETRQGLRLRVSSVLEATKDAEAAAIQLEATVQAGLRKLRENIHEIVAVTPFVSDDFGLQYNYLQSAYAKIIEQTLLEQKGIAVVELGEAQALARELALAGESNPLKRAQFPIYAQGRFRHTENKEQTTLALELEFRRGETVLSQARAAELSSDAIIPWLQEQTGKLITGLGKTPFVAIKPEQEAKQLHTRAQEFIRIGNWEEGVALLEASLLLEPSNELARNDIVLALGRWIGTLYQFDKYDNTPLAIALYRRDLDHLEKLSRIPKQSSLFPQPRFSLELLGIDVWWCHAIQPKQPKDLQAMISEFRKDRVQSLCNIARQRIAAGYSDEGWLAQAFNTVPPDEQLEFVIKCIEEYGDLPVAGHIAGRLIGEFINRHQPSHGKTRKENIRELLKRLAVSRNLHVRNSIASTENTLANIEKWKKTPEMIDSGPEIHEVKTSPLDLKINEDRRLLGCLPARAGIDVFWSSRCLYLMREHGTLQLIWTVPDYRTGILRPIYDGKYVWFMTSHVKSPSELNVLDLQSTKVTHFSLVDIFSSSSEKEMEGVTQNNQRSVIPITAGKICVTGGKSRTWLAIAEFDGTNKTFEIFHEAREASIENDVSQAEDIKVSFGPGFMATLYTNNSQEQTAARILIGRSSRNILVANNPLLIDTSTKTVSVIKGQTWRQNKIPDNLGRDVDQLFFLELGPEPEFIRGLFSFDINTLKKTLLLPNPPDGLLYCSEGKLHIVGKRWFVFDPQTKELKKLLSPVPWRVRGGRLNFGDDVVIDRPLETGESFLESIYSSHHYGTLVFTRDKEEHTKIYLAEILVAKSVAEK